MKRPPTTARLLFVTAVSSGLLAPASARADLDAYDAMGICFAAMFEGPALIAGGAMLYHAVKDRRPSALALVASYLSGAISASFGTIVLAGFDNHDDVSLSLGISAVVVGAIDIGVTTWAAFSQPAGVKKRAVVLAPLLARGGGGAAVHLRW